MLGSLDSSCPDELIILNGLKKDFIAILIFDKN